MNENFNPATQLIIGGGCGDKTILLTPEQYEIDKENPAFSKECGFNIEIVEKPKMIFSSNDIENESVIPQNEQTGKQCETTIPIQSCSGSEQQPTEFEC